MLSKRRIPMLLKVIPKLETKPCLTRCVNPQRAKTESGGCTPKPHVLQGHLHHVPKSSNCIVVGL